MGTHQHTADDVNPAKLRACADLLENPIVSHEPVLHSIVGRIRTCADELDTISRANAELRELVESAYREAWIDGRANAFAQKSAEPGWSYEKSWETSATKEKLTTTEAKK